MHLKKDLRHSSAGLHITQSDGCKMWLVITNSPKNTITVIIMFEEKFVIIKITV